MTDVPVSRELWNRLIKEVRIRTRGRSDAEELLHAAYLRLLRYRTQQTVDNVGAFLVRTAVNIGIDNYRHDRFIADVAPENTGICENSPLQDEVLASRARLDRVREGLSRLTPRTREVFLMHRLEGRGMIGAFGEPCLESGLVALVAAIGAQTRQPSGRFRPDFG